MRIVLKQNQQKEFLQTVKKNSNLSWEKLASLYNISSRTLRDWQKEKLLMKYETAKDLSVRFSVPLPPAIEIRPEFWSTQKAAYKGAIARIKKYGNPGTPEGRRKGGLRSQLLRKKFPSLYPNVRINRIGKINHSTKLAELLGIIFGDGSLSKYQLTIYLNATTDKKYVHEVSKLITEVTGLETFIRTILEHNCTIIKVSSADFIEFLTKNGLVIGDKIKGEATIPGWIINNKSFSKACLRGLIDTDGNIARKNYHANTLAFQITFTNHSPILLKQARDILESSGFTPSIITRNQIHLTRKADVRKYIENVGFNNPKHIQRYNNYLLHFNKH